MFSFFERLIEPTEKPPETPPPELGSPHALPRFYWHFVRQVPGLLAALCARTLVVRAAAVHRRVVELCVYAAIALGLLIVIGVGSYSTFPEQAAGFAEPRYLLPLAPLMAAAVALAARGAGRRFGPATGALIVVLFVAYDVFSQLQVIARYYG